MTYLPNIKGITSTDNTSTTLLTAGSTFTGTGELNNFPDVMVQVTTDQNGTLYCEFSNDGTNWDTSLSFDYDTSRINPPHVFVKGERYFRVRFENTSASAQTYLRLYSYFGTFDKLTAPINGVLSETYDATVVRPTDYKYEVAMGKRQGRSTWNKFGYNLDVDTSSSPEIIAAFGDTFSIMTTADTLDVVSTNANDTSAGSGARMVQIVGIDTNANEVEEFVTLNGTTPVTTVNSYLGVNRMVVISAGSGATNAGDITAADTSASVGTQAIVPAGKGVTQQLIFHTPIGHKFLADWFWFNALKISGGGGSPRIEILGWSYSRVTGIAYDVFDANIDTDVENTVELNPSQPFVIGGREVLYFTASTDVNNTAITGRFSGTLERE